MTEQRHILQEIVDDLLKMENEHDIWDDPPELMVVLNPNEEHGDRHRVFIAMTPDFWTHGHTPDLLWSIVTAMGMPGAPVPPPFIPDSPDDEFVGVVFRSEGWGLTGKTPEETAEIQEWTKAGNRIVDHPKAYETKQYFAVAHDGTLFARMQVRNQEPSEWLEGTDQEGRIPELLRALTTAIRTAYEPKEQA